MKGKQLIIFMFEDFSDSLKSITQNYLEIKSNKIKHISA